MRIHRFYTPFQDLYKAGPGTRLVLSTADSVAHDTDYKALFHQWKDVFNYTAGSQVILFDGRGGEVLAIIEEMGWSAVTLVVLEKIKKDSKNSEDISEKGVAEIGGIWLFASIVKGDNFDWIIQKTTELGVDYIVPVVSDRTIKKNINIERAKKIVIEASEQCGRAVIPLIHTPIKLEEAFEKFTEQGGTLYVCAKGGENFSGIEKLAKKEGGADKSGGNARGAVGFAIGPEGGWSDREEMYFKRHAYKLISLGENVLRAETAAVAVMTLAKCYIKS